MICNVCRRKPELPEETYAVRESPSLSHEEWVWPGIEPTPQKWQVLMLKPHCIQFSRVLVPAGTSKLTLRRHGIQAVTMVMVQCVLSAPTSSTLKWLHRIQCGFNFKHQSYHSPTPTQIGSKYIVNLMIKSQNSEILTLQNISQMCWSKMTLELTLFSCLSVNSSSLLSRSLVWRLSAFWNSGDGKLMQRKEVSKGEGSSPPRSQSLCWCQLQATRDSPDSCGWCNRGMKGGSYLQLLY
jgi:hypothetical protein